MSLRRTNYSSLPTSNPDDFPSSNSSSYNSNSSYSNKLKKLSPLTKLFIAFVSLFFLFLIFFSGSSSNLRRERKVRGTDNPNRNLTIVMNTFKRHDLMKDAINYYSHCDVVKYIHVVWSEPEKPPQKLVSEFLPTDVPQVIIDIQEVDSLNNRFKPLKTAHTDAIFSVDDDMRVPCSDLATAYQVWQNSKETMVGFMPRIHILKDGKLTYRCWWRVWWEGVYSIILTKASIFHKKYLEEYTNLPSEILNMIDKRRNCEDILMQFLISDKSKLPPIYVKGHVSDKGALNGISTSQNVAKADHMRERDDCLNDLVTYFKYNPLVNSTYIVDSASNGWTNRPSTWFEYISSDLWKF